MSVRKPFWPAERAIPVGVKIMSSQADLALQQIDSRRRGFLTKLLAGGATLAALPMMSTVALGDEEADGAKGKGGKGKGGKGQDGKGDAGGQGKGTRGRMDPKKMAADMLAKYDKDGDKALNEQELVAALTAMFQGRGSRNGAEGQGKGGTQGKGQAGGKGKGEGGKGKGDQ